MTDHKAWLAPFAWLALICLTLKAPVGQAHTIVDLAETSEETNVGLQMEGFEAETNAISRIDQALTRGEWGPLNSRPELLTKLRSKKAFWLRATLVNNQADALERWLEFLPLRLKGVDAWVIDPESQEVVRNVKTGLDVPVNLRDIESLRPVVPVVVPAESSRLLVIRVKSDARAYRSYLTINSWTPASFIKQQATRYQFHMVLLAVIVTLFAVLLAQLNVRSCLLGLWMLLLFLLQLDKEGYLSYWVFNDLAGEVINWRYSISLIEKGLFLGISIYLLGLIKQKVFRWLVAFAVSSSLLAVLAGLIVDESWLRYIAAILHLVYAVAWLALLPQALGNRDKWHLLLLALLSLAWLTSLVFSVSFAFSSSYPTQLVPERTYLQVMIVLGLLLVYSRQKKDYEKFLKGLIKEKDRQEREFLERRVDDRTQELNLALETARKANAEKTDFLNRITHDLKSPLTSILGYAQLLRGEQGKAGEMSLMIYTSARHMLNMVTRLIDYARDATTVEAAPGDIYLYAFFDTIEYEANILARKNGNWFHLNVGELATPVVRSDETFLREVLINLIDNACKHTYKGDITLEVACVSFSDSRKLALQCDVRDTGAGIPEKQKRRLFQPFFQADQKSEGVGLGLSIVNELAGKLGGEVNLESEVGVGTRVRVEIPVEQGEKHSDAALLNAPGHLLPWFDATGRVVWLVEDAPAINRLLTLELECLCFDVRAFRSAESVLSAIERGTTPPDLVLTDYRLPGAFGDEVLRAVKNYAPNVPVILLSATWSLNNQWRGGPEPGFDACLGKPVDLACLRRAIAEALSIPLALPVESETVTESVSEEMPGQPPAPEVIAQLEQWLELGAVTDLVEWCNETAASCPADQELAERIFPLAERGDFSGIKRVLKAYKGHHD
ncbi:MAG: response regulator [Alteromonadaceae bacterium]|nr:response regulator [Alteromonadaceae bacterium]